MAETVIEDFTSLSDWTGLGGSLTASGGQGAGATAAADNISYLTGGSYGPDIFFGLTIATVPGDNEYVLLFARLNSATLSGYFVSIVKSSGTDTMYIRRITGGVPTTLNSWSQEVASGNRIGIDCTGTTISAYVDTGSGWTLVGSVTDGTYTAAGTTAVSIFNTVGRVDDLVQVTADAAVAAGGGQLTPMGIW